MEWGSSSTLEKRCPELRTHPTNVLISYPHCFLAVRKKIEDCVYLHHDEVGSSLEPKKSLTRKGKEGAATWSAICVSLTFSTKCQPFYDYYW